MTFGGGTTAIARRAYPSVLATGAVAYLFVRDISRWQIWYDEAYSWMLIRNEPAELIERTAGDVHPPLYYLALKAWAAVLGSTLTPLRAFSALCMLLAVMATARLCRELHLSQSRWESAAVIVVAGTGSMTLVYAQEVRMYGLSALLVALATLALLRLDRRPTGGNALVYGTLLAACGYTHYLSAGFVLVHLWWWRQQEHAERRTSRLLLVGIGFAAITYVPWLPQLWRQLRHVDGGFWIEAVSWRTPVAVLYQVLSADALLPDVSAMALVGVVAVLVVAAGLAGAERTERDGILLLVGPLALSLVLLYLISLDVFGFSSVLLARYLVPLAPMLYAGMCVAVLTAFRSTPLMGALAGLVLAALLARGLHLASDGVSREWRADVASVAAHLERHASSGDLLVVDRYFHFLGIAHHLDGDHRIRVADEGEYLGGVRPMLDAEGLLVSPSELESHGSPIWLVRDQEPLPQYRKPMAGVVAGRRIVSVATYRGLEILELGPPLGRSAPACATADARDPC